MVGEREESVATAQELTPVDTPAITPAQSVERPAQSVERPPSMDPLGISPLIVKARAQKAKEKQEREQAVKSIEELAQKNENKTKSDVMRKLYENKLNKQQEHEQERKESKIKRGKQALQNIKAKVNLMKLGEKIEETGKLTKGRRYTKRGKYIELDGNNITNEDRLDFYEQDVAADRINNPSIIKNPSKTPIVKTSDANIVFKTPSENKGNVTKLYKHNEVVVKEKNKQIGLNKNVARKVYSNSEKVDTFFKLFKR
jgi:hypothetical protein